MSCHICLELGVETCAAESSYICLRHRNLIWDLLGRIGSMWRILRDPYFLAATSEPVSDMATRSRPPCSLDPIVVSDPRSQMEHPSDLVSAPRVLGAWVQAVAEARGDPYTSAYDVPDYVMYLKARLYWIESQPACVRFARHMGAVHRSLQKVTFYD